VVCPCVHKWRSFIDVTQQCPLGAWALLKSGLLSVSGRGAMAGSFPGPTKGLLGLFSNLCVVLEC
jgi:hypothetical protein